MAGPGRGSQLPAALRHRRRVRGHAVALSLRGSLIRPATWIRV